jgi:Fe-S cluster biogenesis protein NfuA/nitrite reductase/ring-hydroxylating ferredoxin subunit
MDDREARERVARVEALLEEVEALPDPRARERSTEFVGVLLDLYGEGLARLVERLPDRATLVDDELVSHLLLVHGIHPEPVETRVLGALDEVRPYLESHGGNVELIGIEEGVVQLRMQGSCSGCPSSAMTLKLAIEDAIHKHAPDVEDIRAEDAEQTPGPALIQLGDAAPAPELIQLPQLVSGGTLLKRVAGEQVLFLRVDGTFYAYRPDCVACGATLEAAELRDRELDCAGCRRSYDVARAGRCKDAPELQLEPVPLLVDDSGLVKVALAAAAG